MGIAQRSSLAAAGLTCLAALTLLPAAASGQQRGQPNAETPRLLVATFRTANDGAHLGVDGAEALRSRVQREVNAQDLWVIPRDQMNSFLKDSGFPADTTLSLDDLRQLAQTFRADSIVDGVVTKTANGVELRARLVLPSNVALVQPLPVVSAPTVGEAAKELEKHLEAAQRSLLDFRRCSDALLARKFNEAQAAAQLGIVRYPSSTLSRLCLMDAYSREQQPIDSIIRAADAVLRIDSTSVLALMNLVDSYRDKHDTVDAMDAMRRLVVYRPDLRADFIKMLMQANRPRIALQVIDQILRENPGDAARLRDRWLLLLADRRWKDALQAGEELVKADSSAATADYFSRSIAAALADSQFVLAARIGASGIAKFASDADLWTLSAQAQRKSDRRADAIASVRRALVLNPRTENAWALLVSTQIEAGQLDSAIASAHLGLAAGADTTAIRGILAVPMGIAAKRADSVKTRAAWLEVVRLAALIDSVAPSPAAKFFLALGSFQVGFDALQTIDTNHRCDEAKLIEDMWAIAAINAPLGAKAGPEQARGAAQMMTVMQQYLDPVSKAKTAFCKKKR